MFNFTSSCDSLNIKKIVDSTRNLCYLALFCVTRS